MSRCKYFFDALDVQDAADTLHTWSCSNRHSLENTIPQHLAYKIPTYIEAYKTIVQVNAVHSSSIA